MILLLEGCNRCGKTTLARKFSEALNWPIIKFNVPPDNAFAYFHEALIAGETTQSLAHPNMILDRCHLSNYAYNGQLGGGVLSPEEWRCLDEFLRHMETWLFLMVDDPQAIVERLQAAGERSDGAQHLTRAQVGPILNRFNEAYERSTIETKASFRLPQLFDGSAPTGQFHLICEKIIKQMNG